MAKREIKFEIDLIGKPQFRRLVEFVSEIEDLARVNCNDELKQKVTQVRSDLAGMA